MKNPSTFAEAFIETRNHHLLELAEDYVEIIYNLIQEKNEARVCDIAKYIGVSHVTVIRTVDRLKKKGLLLSQKHHPITLTKEGIKLAVLCKKRHTFLLKYLLALGIPERNAKIDVEGMEHHISPVTLKALQRHYNLKD